MSQTWLIGTSGIPNFRVTLGSDQTSSSHLYQVPFFRWQSALPTVSDFGQHKLSMEFRIEMNLNSRLGLFKAC